MFANRKRNIPIVNAESATLNAGQCHLPTKKSIKSITWLIVTLSMRLPIAPPRIMERDRVSILSSVLSRYKIINMIAMREIIINILLPRFAKSPKAAPVFLIFTILKNGNTLITSYGFTYISMRFFVM